MNKRIIYLTISIISIVLLIIGSTYAWAKWQTANNEQTNVVFTAGSGFSCAANGGGDITSSSVSLAPANCNDSNYVLKRTITLNVTNQFNTMPVSLDMWLNVENIDTNLLNSNNFKYTIVPQGMNCNYGVHQEINDNISNDKIDLLKDIRYIGDTNSQYDLYIWLDEAETNINTMNQNFHFTIGGSCTTQLPNTTLTNTDAQFDTGSNVNIKMKQLAGGDSNTTSNTNNTNITAIRYSNTPPTASNMTSEHVVSISTTPIYMWYENGVIYWWSEDKHPSLNSDASSMFRTMSNLTDISGLQSMDASTATNMQTMFTDDESLTSVDALVNWNTSNVTNLLGTFGCNNNCTLSNVDGLSNWNVSSVTTMGVMLQNQFALSDISGLTNWNTTNVTTLNTLFYNCSSLTNLNALSKWNVSNVTNMQGIFGINNEFLDKPKLTDISGIRNWNVSKVQNMQSILQNQVKLVDFSPLTNWDTSSVTNMAGIFIRCYEMNNANFLVIWNISNVTNLGALFQYCTKLTSIDLSKWNTSNVTNMSEMFEGNANLEHIYVSDLWSTSNVTNSTDMFTGCSKLPNFNSSVVDKTNAFVGSGGYLELKPNS